MNMTIKIDKIIIRDTNLFSFTDKFSKEFVGIQISLFTNVFSEYDQIFLIKINRNFITFIISFDLNKNIYLI